MASPRAESGVGEVDTATIAPTSPAGNLQSNKLTVPILVDDAEVSSDRVRRVLRAYRHGERTSKRIRTEHRRRPSRRRPASRDVTGPGAAT